MKNRFFKRLVSGLTVPVICLASVPFISNAADQQQIGNKDGYDYELWNQWGQGTASMDVGNNGSFTCSWTGIENCLFRTGQKLGSTKSYEEYNGMYIDYDVDYEPKGNSYMCVYGWTEDPTVEYYIVEAWGSWRPPGSTDSLGTVEANGNTYDIYRTERVNQPSIHGTETFYQYWSVRQDNPAVNNSKKHIEGRISISKHFDAWESAGLDMSGRMYEVALNIEGYQSAGSASVNKNGLVIGKGNGDSGSVVTPTNPPAEPDENGHYFRSTFESGDDGWGSRGDSSVKLDSENYYSGKNSLFVSGRTDNWNGTAVSLDTSKFVSGKSYSFSTAVLQKSGSTTPIQLTLQYTLDGKDNYSQVAVADVKSGEWTKLENTSFTIPEGAKNLLLYVEAPESLTDFYIDEAVGAKAGIKSEVINGGGTVAGISQPSTTPPEKPSAGTATLWGDVNCDGEVSIADATLLLQHLGNMDKYVLSEQGFINADVYENGGGLSAQDALTIQRYEAGAIDKLPVGESVQEPAVSAGGVDISWIDPSKPMMALSFDDGTSPDTGNRIINALSDEGFHATFFYIGSWIKHDDDEEEIRNAYSKGMEIANHTQTHPKLSEKSADEIRSEYEQCAERLRGIIGAEPSKLLRLPYLASNDTVISTLSDVPMITCAVDTQDWNGASKEQIVETIKNGMNNGSLNGAIILAHETYDSTASAVEELAPYIKEQGWQIVTVSEMFAVKNQELNGGQIYTKTN